MKHSKFKVVIVGGNVSGLMLANMLEKLNIDYVVLESYETIAPQVVLSIGRIAPLYNIARTFLSYVYQPLAVTVTPAQDVSVATLLGTAGWFVVPTNLMFIPFASFEFRQKLTAFWQPSPMYVGLLATGILAYMRRIKTADDASIPKDEQNAKQKQRQQEQ